MSINALLYTTDESFLPDDILFYRSLARLDEPLRAGFDIHFSYAVSSCLRCSALYIHIYYNARLLFFIIVA